VQSIFLPVNSSVKAQFIMFSSVLGNLSLGGVLRL
jgi:hypothetical protein